MTFYIGAQTLGSQGITTIFGPGTLQNGESVTALRDRLVPEFGIPNVGKRWAGSNVLVFHRDNVQFWVSLDQTNWQLIIPADGTNPNGILFVDTGSNGTTAAAVAGGVPAVGGIGLAVLAAVLLGVGGLIITRRTRASAI